VNHRTLRYYRES